MNEVEHNVRIALAIDMDDIEDATEVQGLSAFCDKHPEAKQEALDNAFGSVTRYIDKNVPVFQMVVDAVFRTSLTSEK